MTNTSDKTFLGIDYGERRIGIAKSDPTGLIASALTTLVVRSRQHAVDELLRLIAEYEPAGLVVGYPLLPSGDKSKKCEQIDRFLLLLQKSFTGPIYREDERYSSTEAADIIHAHGKRTGKDKKRIDRLAAVIILQRFLDENRT
ncbi:MAG: Holliday junction resolvase RuvX [candidate division Zixibacteria bacterium]|jgi:putative Holliday junction resolvase|nr:Holliday junction resolvase RuvX [candidate division Zixibacteria bacterium]